jgi:putative peptide zinc metalloprotease protein
MKPLYQKRVVTGLQYHEAKTMNKCAQAELAQIEGEKAAMVSKGTLEAEDEVARRNKELAEAEAALVLLEAGTRPEEIEAAEASLGRQREELAFLVELNKKLPLHSRVAGVITTPHFKDRVGEFFNDGALVCEIEESSLLEVEITLDEDQVHDVVPGQRVELKARALPYETFEASVERIAPAAVGGELQSTLVVYCHLENRSGRLRPAMSGHARIYGHRTPIGKIALDYVMRFIRTEFWW